MRRLTGVLLLLTLLVLPHGGPAAAAALKDSESASHGDTAATYQVAGIYEYPGYKVVQYTLAVLSHYSYMLVSGKDAAVIDPGRDVDTYLATLKRDGLTLKAILLTHSHADFVAGHTELRSATGAPIYASNRSGAGYPHEPLQDGSLVAVGTATVRALETPGHTPDGITFAVNASGASVPDLLFTGDTLFVGSIGRPDLMGGRMAASTLASMAFDSWTTKLATLPDATVVLPAHGAGSLCGAHLSDAPSSTIGAERHGNAYLKFTSRSDFIAAILEGLPEAPQYFGHNAAMNREGPPLVDWKAPVRWVTASKSQAMPTSTIVVDLRAPADYAAAHVPGSLAIGLRGRLETWVGIMVPWGSDLVVVGSEDEVAEAVHRLHRVGYDGARGLKWTAWMAAKLPVKSFDPITPAALRTAMEAGTGPLIVDVRLPNEWMGLRIGQVINLPLNHLAELSSKIETTKPVVAVCNSAYRSTMAVGVLERQGFTDATSMAGGSEAWIAEGYPVFGSSQTAAPAAVAVRDVRLADRISPVDLGRLMQDLPGTFDLVDIRPADAFADYRVPGSVNVHVADLLADARWLTGAGPLVVVDRDGSLAMMAAGILSQKTARRVQALHGGLEAWWRANGPMGGGSQAPAAQTAPAVPGVARPPVAAPSAPQTPQPRIPQAPSAPARRSAGC